MVGRGKRIGAPDPVCGQEEPRRFRIKLKKQHVYQAALRLSRTKKGRDRIADALDVSTIDAWMIQESLKRAVEELERVQAYGSWPFRRRA